MLFLQFEHGETQALQVLSVVLKKYPELHEVQLLALVEAHLEQLEAVH